MKTLLTAFVMVLAFEAQAQLISHRYSYIHHESHMRLEISKVDQDNQTAKYFDSDENKLKTVNLSEVSQETNEEIDGVKVKNMVLVKFSDHTLRPCEVWYLYSNALAHVGCQTGKNKQHGGTNRPVLGTYTASIESMVKELPSLDGFEKKDRVRLQKNVGDLKQGDLVRIEHIFQNGSALVQKMGENLVDTSSLLMKFNVQVVELKDLSFKK